MYVLQCSLEPEDFNSNKLFVQSIMRNSSLTLQYSWLVALITELCTTLETKNF